MSTCTTKCKYCNINIKNGIVRDSKIFCNDTCFRNYSVCYRLTLIPKYVPIPKKCNYCLYEFDASIKPGINYKTLWFCCQDHLNLANPRPKVMFHPSAPYGMMTVHGGHRFVHIFGPNLIDLS